MIDRGGAYEPGGWHKSLFAIDHLFDVKELVEVEEEPREVGDEEHANDEDQNESQLQVFGLLAAAVLLFALVTASGLTEPDVNLDVEVE